MKYKTPLITGACVVAFTLCGTLAASAQGNKSPSPSPAASAAASPTAKSPRAIPFRGTASAVDQTAKTFTIAGKSASRVFKITDKTTVTKAGEAATLADLADNDAVTGSYWKQEDGSLETKSLKIGGKTDAEKASTTKKTKKADEAASSSNAAAVSPSPSPKKK